MEIRPGPASSWERLERDGRLAGSYPQAGPICTNPVPVRPNVSTPEGERYFPDRMLRPDQTKVEARLCRFCQRPHMVGAERGRIDGRVTRAATLVMMLF